MGNTQRITQLVIYLVANHALSIHNMYFYVTRSGYIGSNYIQNRSKVLLFSKLPLQGEPSARSIHSVSLHQPITSTASGLLLVLLTTQPFPTSGHVHGLCNYLWENSLPQINSQLSVRSHLKCLPQRGLHYLPDEIKFLVRSAHYSFHFSFMAFLTIIIILFVGSTVEWSRAHTLASQNMSLNLTTYWGNLHE